MTDELIEDAMFTNTPPTSPRPNVTPSSIPRPTIDIVNQGLGSAGEVWYSKEELMTWNDFSFYVGVTIVSPLILIAMIVGALAYFPFAVYRKCKS